jgi:hypothetical protein
MLRRSIYLEKSSILIRKPISSSLKLPAAPSYSWSYWCGMFRRSIYLKKSSILIRKPDSSTSPGLRDF